MMKKFLVLSVFLLSPVSAQAGFSVKDIQGNTVSTADAPPAASPARNSAHPALEIINDRYVPEDVKQKYKMGDDHFEMTETKPLPPVVVQPAASPQKKKRLEIISGPPPVIVIPVTVEPVIAKETAPMPVVAQAAPAPTPPVQSPVPVARTDTWRARQGEVLKDVLKRWSDRAGNDFIWTAAESPKVSREFSYMGTFENAVAGLMQQDSGTLKMKFADDATQIAGNEPVPLTAEKGSDMRAAPEKGPNAVPQKSWFAAKDASLQGVLRAWAETEGATLIWQADRDFAVTKSLNEKGGFEDAVSVILSAYDKMKARPIGQLYKNPVSGEKVLVIKTDRS